jgi:hypothetical protein
MTDHTANLVKNLIGGYFGLLASASVVGIGYVVINVRSASDPASLIIAYGGGLGFLLMIFATLAIGIYRGRRWTVELHAIILAIWVVITGPVTLLVSQTFFRVRDPGYLLYYLFVLAVPIMIQVFLLKYRDRLFSPGPRLALWQKIGVGLAIAYSAVVLVLVWIVMLLGGLWTPPCF